MAKTPQTEGPPLGTSGKYAFYKWLTFGLMYIGYTLSVLNRKSFSFALPAIMEERDLDKDDLGLIASSQNLAYTFSKFLGGVVSDSVNPKILFGSGLFASGLCTISFTALDGVSGFAAIWFLHGIVQGGGWPACAKILKHWCNPTEFGTLWSVLSTSMNVACSVGPLMTLWFLSHSSWSSTFWIFGISSMVVALVSGLFIVNSPTEIGYESFADSKKDQGKRGKGRGSWQDMLQSPFMWVCCASYMVVYMARTAMLDWGQLYLINECELEKYIGSVFVSSFETGGIVGSVVAGYLADRLVATSRREDTRGTPRMKVCMGFMVLIIVGLHLMIFHIDEDSSKIWITLIGFIQGFGIYGPVSVYGVMAIEAAPTHLSGTSHAMVGLAANIGAIIAGLPFSRLAKTFEWSGAFVVLEGLAIVILIVKVLTRNLEYKMIPIRKKLE